MTKLVLTNIIIVLLTHSLYSQQAGHPTIDPRSNSTSRFYKQNDLIKAKSASDKCFAWNRNNDLLTSKNWFYRALIYQKFYKDFDSLNTSFENKYFRDLPETDIKHLYGRLTKDTTLVISTESYLKYICHDIKNDSINFEMLTNDSVYRKRKMEKFNTFEFANNKYMTPLRDSILSQIVEYLEIVKLPDWGKGEVYKEIFKGIIENDRMIE